MPLLIKRRMRRMFGVIRLVWSMVNPPAIRPVPDADRRIEFGKTPSRIEWIGRRWPDGREGRP
jgi:hypothetical protein